jgi:thiol-disulfide isomerase/thioredoxin
MAPILEFLSTKIRPYYSIVLIAVITIIFILASYYGYKQFILPSLNDKTKVFKDVANNGERRGEIDVLLFHVDWCPHCKKALPDWVAFCSENNGKPVNGYTVNCDPAGINCTDDSDPKIAALVSENNINSYPTVILFKDGQRYNFEAKLTKNALDQFVQQVTSQ